MANARQDRGQGVPLTDSERQTRHYEQTGDWLDELPRRGTGLGGLNYEAPTWLKSNWKWMAGFGGILIAYVYIIKKDKRV